MSKDSAGSWRDWSRLESCESAEVVSVRTQEDIHNSLRSALAQGRRIRPVGAGHSFTGIALAPDIRLDLSRWTGVVTTDPERRRITLRSGTHLWEIPGLLAPTGWAMQNLGDIDRQTLAGAVSTGTHGTGAAFGALASQVVGLRMITGTGDDITVDESTPELLDALRVSLGAYGVITEITLQLVEAFDLHVREDVRPWAEVLESWEHLCAAEDHFEFFWFGHSNRVVTKTSTRMPPGRRTAARRHPVAGFVNDEILGNVVFDAACRVAARAPSVIPGLNRIATSIWRSPERIQPSHELFASPRRVRFAECEYALPMHLIPVALRQLRTLFRSGDWGAAFPVEVRCAASDTAWLASNHGRATGYVAVHQHRSADHRGFFAAAEEIFTALGGRPHWGKLHSLGAAELTERYPRFTDAQELRGRMDPERILTNDHLDRVFGLGS